MSIIGWMLLGLIAVLFAYRHMRGRAGRERRRLGGAWIHTAKSSRDDHGHRGGGPMGGLHAR